MARACYVGFMKYVLSFALFLGLAACASLSEDECRAGKWYDIGFEDGTNGRKAGFLQEHAEACAEYAIKPNASEWQRGREAGLPLYCKRERAYREGSRGKVLSNVCPASMTASLERANRRGLRFHAIEQEIREVESDIRSINAELSGMSADDPNRSILLSELSFLRLDLLSLRSERARFRF